jgi:lysophospholipase L1-like esterase
MKKIILIATIISTMAMILPPEKKITIWMCGDSTMSIKETGTYPETGWGMPFMYFWDSAYLKVVNKAKNGRSTKTFISENIWKSVIDNVKEDDYVFIEFGHNDESKEKKERYTTIEEYKNNLANFVNESRAKKAIPVLFTPVSRRKFNKEGVALETHKLYTAAMLSLADSLKVPIIDLDLKTRNLYQQFGDTTSRLLFLQLKPGEHPNYPDGREDNTHFSELGARLTSQMALKELLELFPNLKEYLVKPVKKKI